jgi:hypothetical protein
VVAPSGGRGAGLTADEVLRYLRPHGAAGTVALELNRAPSDFDELDRAIAALPRLVIEERLPRRHPGFGRYFDSLPRILFFYGRGYSCDEIASEMTFVATGFGVETVLGIVAEMLAKRANRGG